MTVALETEIVGTRHDPILRVHYYTIERGGRRWTAAVKDSDLDGFSGPRGRQMRREYIARALQTAMTGVPDP